MRKQKKSIVTATLFMAITLILFLPGGSIAGPLEPTDPPGSTMRTLDEIYSTNSWSKKLPCDSTTNCPRFEVLADFNDEAVLDKETGLVWARSPWNYGVHWYRAQQNCMLSYIGDRFGWRLPTMHEIESLRYYCDDPWVRLPCGHPFINLNLCYWSVTTVSWDSNQAHYFCPRTGEDFAPKTTDVFGYWCVRAGSGVNYE